MGDACFYAQPIGSKFNVQGGDGTLNLEPATSNRAEGLPASTNLS